MYGYIDIREIPTASAIAAFAKLRQRCKRPKRFHYPPLSNFSIGFRLHKTINSILQLRMHKIIPELPSNSASQVFAIPDFLYKAFPPIGQAYDVFEVRARKKILMPPLFKSL